MMGGYKIVQYSGHCSSSISKFAVAVFQNFPRYVHKSNNLIKILIFSNKRNTQFFAILGATQARRNELKIGAASQG